MLRISVGILLLTLIVFGSLGCKTQKASITLDLADIDSPSLALTASVTDVTAHLSWKARLSDSYYKIYRHAENKPSEATQLASDLVVQGASYSDPFLSSGTTYHYWIKGCNDRGCSDFSNVVVLTTVPSLPSLTSSLKGSSAHVSWKEMPVASYYEIYRYFKGKASEIQQLASPKKASYSDTAIKPGTEYNYRVKACNSGGCSDFSAAENLITVPPQPRLHGVVKDSVADLTWGTVVTATSYKVYRRIKGNARSTTPLTAALAGSSSSYTDTGLTAGSEYNYWLEACTTRFRNPFCNRSFLGLAEWCFTL